MAVSAPVFYPNQAFWQTARQIEGSGVKSFPIPRSPAHFMLERLYAIRKANYVRGTFDTADPVETAAYLQDEQVFRESPAFTYFRRLYSTIPAQHEEPGSSTYQFPGFEQTTSQGAVKTISAFSFSTYAFTSAGHGFSDGDYVYAKTVWQFASGVAFFHSGVHQVYGSDSTTFKLKPQAFQWSTTFVSGTVYAVAPSRNPVTLTSPGRTVYTYYLPGVSSGISDEGDITMVDPFQITDGTGAITDTVSATTTPTLAEYLGLVAGGSMIPIESYIEPYLGNIVRTVTRYIKAL